ncbi:MAG: hypothetical protein IKU15_00270 [Clostridia bacterium]|nr:hypothetical protein [Clostridia bacterium]
MGKNKHQEKHYIFRVDKITYGVGSKEETSDYIVQIRKGTTGEEMTYSLTALLQVVLAHEETQGNTFTVDGFINYLGMLLKDSMIGVPEDD